MDDFTAALPAMLADLETLVTCETPSADLAALAKGAEVTAEFGTRLLGTPPERITVGGRTHLRWDFGDAPARVLLLGHYDTVWPIGTLERIPWSVTGGVVRGPGCFDMKAGLVMIFHALAALPDRAGITVLVNADEEIGSPTSGALVEENARGRTAALVLEPSADGGALKIARKGVARHTVEVHGRAAHAGLEPERGINALVEAAHQVQVIAALADPGVGTTVTPTMMSAGSAGNTVPALASVEIDVRAATAAEQLRVETALAGLRPRTPGVSLRSSTSVSIPPLERAASAGLFDLARRVAGGRGTELRGVAVGGGSDGNRTAAAGTPTLDGLGAVGGGAHADDEHVVVAELPGRTGLLVALLSELLGGTSGTTKSAPGFVPAGPGEDDGRPAR
ncbi:M20 family metallopeptidase [Spongiactinospora gelatinilytica]|uniref:M20 family metallopeptidase n=1 Tax=Spongiactinospora gelatinilytica TaxID=2666298 RepID=UPI0018F4A8C1|nr:M20 family metallopeptidase [Spongiactinospora gelatinilytica]